ncbi:MAG: zinc-dependent peptidase [Coleofasciculus sp. S288]|nr:zinc-dependent peptidase [Coleofasciculus sp. S288]
MIKALIFLLFILIIIALILGIDTFKRLRYIHLRNKQFPSDWTVIIERNVPLYKHLSESWRRRLYGHINVLLTQKTFKGCGGLQITNEIKLTIAAQAALLLLSEKGNYFSKLRLILVYPSAFIASQTTPFGEYYLEETQVKTGESWQIGIVVLSWQDIQYDAKHWQDGRNVVLHEFAHQLDQEGGSASGVPILEKRSDYVTWGRIFRKEYEQLCYEVERGMETVMDEYGATAPAEFFAVATETFFEKPFHMKRKHPELYNELKRYYKLDSVDWIEGAM